MAKPQDMKVELTSELIEWKPPKYEWKCQFVFDEELEKKLNATEDEGWEIFQVVKSGPRLIFTIIARRPVENEE